MKNFWSWTACLALVGAAGCASHQSYVKKGEIQQTINQDQEHKDYLETIGLGAADSTLTNTTQRKATSRDAAIVQAQYEMLSIVRGVELDGGITVQKAMETDSNLETTIKAVIKGADIIKTEWTNDDGCVVTLHLNKKRLAADTGLKFKS